MSLICGLHGSFTLGGHEASCTLIRDGEVLGIFEEERYTRVKGGHGILPDLCIKAALKQCRVEWEAIDLIVTPGITYPYHRTRWREYLAWKFGPFMAPIHIIHHQDAHLKAARYHAQADDPIVLALDSRGDGASGAIRVRTPEKTITNYRRENQSFGAFYTAMTNLIGFNDGDEYKLMGLAAYGLPDVDLSDFLQGDQTDIFVNPKYLNADAKSPFEPAFSHDLVRLVGKASREDIASSTQFIFERRLQELLSPAKKTTLMAAGGVALNCVAFGKLLGLFERVLIPPCASDRGLSLGCAYWGALTCGDSPRPLRTALLGTEYSNDEIRKELDANGISYRETNDPAAVGAEYLADGRIIGWHQGRSECGARALGARSILADPRRSEMRDTVNAKIKYRENFRPFAPAILAESAQYYFRDGEKMSPYMTLATATDSDPHHYLGATDHMGTARVQTVLDDGSPFRRLLGGWRDLSGCPALLNTSFNLKGQPIVESPRDALMTFAGCGLDALIIGNFVVEKRG